MDLFLNYELLDIIKAVALTVLCVLALWETGKKIVEILNAYLKTMGLKLVFKRIPKKKKQAIYIKPMSFYDEYNEPREPLVMYADGERVDLESIINKLIDQENRKDAMKIPAMSFFDEVKEDEEES